MERFLQIITRKVFSLHWLICEKFFLAIDFFFISPSWPGSPALLQRWIPSEGRSKKVKKGRWVIFESEISETVEQVETFVTGLQNWPHSYFVYGTANLCIVNCKEPKSSCFVHICYMESLKWGIKTWPLNRSASSSRLKILNIL